MPDLGHVLIVGGTGMLEGATRWVARNAQAVTLVARHPAKLAALIGATPCPLDWADNQAANTLPDGPFDLALVWLHDTAVHLSRPIANRLRPHGRLIRIHGALSADPEIARNRAPDPRGDVVHQMVILGWYPDSDANTGKRWLTHQEICEGVIDAVQSPEMQCRLIGAQAGA